MRRGALFVLAALAVPQPALAAAQADGPPHLSLPRVSRVPEIAELAAMDAAGNPFGMVRVEGFVQRFPNDGADVSERTVVYAGYDADVIYVAFLCFDSQPDRIGAHVLPRDAFPNDEDTVAVHIDTFRDLKHAYGFQTNAFGVQTDGTYTEGLGWDLSWDTVWRSDAVRTATGWVALFRIPFKSLRFPAADTQTWGLFFYRAIARKNEQVYWPACSTRVAARFRQAAIVSGITRVSRGRNLQAIPYAASRAFRVLDVAPTGAASFVTRSADAAIGLDGKAVVRDSLVVDATVNPDFSQIESDQPQITVNRPFEVFFPEKRPFFLENASSFTTPIPLLFTRRIADPRIGGRTTGRAGPYAVGAMVVDDAAPAAVDPSRGTTWFGVARVIRDLGRESYAGGFVSARDQVDAANDIAAVDGRLKIGANWFAAGQGVVTRASDRGVARRDGSALFASLVGSGRRFNYELDVNDRSPHFTVVDGFIPRVDLRSVDQTISLRARPERGALQAWGPDLIVNRTWTHAGRPLDWSATPRIDFQWPGTTILDVYYTAARQTLRPGEVQTATTVEDLPMSRVGATFTSAILPRVIGSGAFFAGDAPNLTPRDAAVPVGARITDATATATIRLTPSLMLDLSYLFDRLRDAASDRGIYTNTIVRMRVGRQFTRAAALRAIVQYSELTVDARETTLQPARNLNYDVLFTYLTTPGTALYVGANYNLDDIDAAFASTAGVVRRSPRLNNTGWQLFTKVSYLVRR